MSETVPLDQFIATSNAALTYKAERDALAAQVSTLQQERQAIRAQSNMGALVVYWTDRAVAAESAVSTLREAVEAFVGWVHGGPFRPGVHYMKQLDEQVEILRAALASTPGDPDAST